MGGLFGGLSNGDGGSPFEDRAPANDDTDKDTSTTDDNTKDKTD